MAGYPSAAAIASHCHKVSLLNKGRVQPGTEALPLPGTAMPDPAEELHSWNPKTTVLSSVLFQFPYSATTHSSIWLWEHHTRVSSGAKAIEPRSSLPEDPSSRVKELLFT